MTVKFEVVKQPTTSVSGRIDRQEAGARQDRWMLEVERAFLTSSEPRRALAHAAPLDPARQANPLPQGDLAQARGSRPASELGKDAHDLGGQGRNSGKRLHEARPMSGTAPAAAAAIRSMPARPADVMGGASASHPESTVGTSVRSASASDLFAASPAAPSPQTVQTPPQWPETAHQREEAPSANGGVPAAAFAAHAPADGGLVLPAGPQANAPAASGPESSVETVATGARGSSMNPSSTAMPSSMTHPYKSYGPAVAGRASDESPDPLQAGVSPAGQVQGGAFAPGPMQLQGSKPPAAVADAGAPAPSAPAQPAAKAARMAAASSIAMADAATPAPDQGAEPETEEAAAPHRNASLHSRAETEAFAKRLMHVYLGDDGMHAWIRDAALGPDQVRAVVQAMTSEFSASGVRLAGLSVNGKPVVESADRDDDAPDDDSIYEETHAASVTHHLVAAATRQGDA